MNIKKYLPSKRFAIFISAMLVTALGIWIYNGYQNYKKGQITNVAEKVKALNELVYQDKTVQDIVNLDTDGDSVPDWEENLWGLDPKKKDSNDDGVADNIEIERRQSTFTNENSTPIEGNTSTTTPTLNETDKFAQDLFTTVAALQQSGNLSSEGLDSITKSMADYIKNVPQSKIYTLADLKLYETEGSKITNNYKDGLQKIVEKYMTGTKTTTEAINQTLTILSDAVQNEDSTKLDELDPIIKDYGTVIAQLLKLQAPKSASLIHLDLLNSLELIRENTTNMKLIYTNPLLALSATVTYTDNWTKLFNSLDDLKKYFADKGINIE